MSEVIAAIVQSGYSRKQDKMKGGIVIRTKKELFIKDILKKKAFSDYDRQSLQTCARIKAIVCLAYASYMGFLRLLMECKKCFLYWSRLRGGLCTVTLQGVVQQKKEGHFYQSRYHMYMRVEKVQLPDVNNLSLLQQFGKAFGSRWCMAEDVSNIFVLDLMMRDLFVCSFTDPMPDYTCLQYVHVHQVSGFSKDIHLLAVKRINLDTKGRNSYLGTLVSKDFFGKLAGISGKQEMKLWLPLLHTEA
ncbi:hypothetical protein Tco_0635564 [Tanacetum coccineum]